jgi:MFS family permease
MKILLRNNHQYLKLIFANIINRFGDSVDMIAFSWLTYEVTKSASWAAIIVGVNLMVSIIFQPIVGGYVEGKNKKKIIVRSDAIRFILISALVILYSNNFVDTKILVIFTVFISFIETFRIPAGVSIIPMLLAEEDYDEGISLNNGVSKVSELIGLFLTGVLIARVGAIGAIFIDGVTFLISAIVIYTIQYQDTTKRNADSSNYFLIMQDGFNFLIKHSQLLLICIICALINAIVVPFDSLQAVYTNLYFEGNAYIMSAISVAIAIGMVIGSFSYKRVIKDKNPKNRTVILSIGGTAIGIFYLGMSLASSLYFQLYIRILIAVLLSFLVGIFLAYLNAYVQVFFIQNVHRDYLARIAAISTTITIIGSPVSAFLTAGLAKIMSCRTIFLITGIISIICFLILSKKLKVVEE